MSALTGQDLAALWVTLRLAAITTLVLLLFGSPLAWWLARSRAGWWQGVIEAITALPLVLPPTVLGFYLLLLLGRDGPVGAFLERHGGQAPAFTFSGLVIGSVLYSLPFVVQPLQNAFAQLPQRALEAAATLGAGPVDRFWSIVLPLSRQGYVTAAVLGFAHTLGEFGVVLMIGGNIPGQTQVLSIAIYDHVEALAYDQAHWLSAGLLVISFALLMLVYGLNRRLRKHQHAGESGDMA